MTVIKALIVTAVYIAVAIQYKHLCYWLIVMDDTWTWNLDDGQ